MVIRKEKEPKRKENRPAGKVENAMKLRFPLSHRACHQKQRTTGDQTQTNKEGGLSAAVIDPPDLVGPARYKPATDPAVSNRRHPAVLVDAEQQRAKVWPQGLLQSRKRLCST